MNQWDILLYPFDREGPHPAVVISNEERCSNPDLDYVNVLLCTSAKLSRAPKRHEVLLDEADGLDWKTAVRCDLFYLLPKSEFGENRGKVSELRRRQITRKLMECLRLMV